MKKTLSNHGTGQVVLATVSAVPLFSVANGVQEAILLSGSVLLSIFVFEGIFFIVKRFWLRSLRLPLALLTIASLLSGIFLIGGPFFSDATLGVRAAFPLTLVSAFLLAHHTISTSAPPFINRVWVWSGFFALLFIIGIVRQWSGAFQVFSPGPFWIAGAALAAFYLVMRGMKV